MGLNPKSFVIGGLFLGTMILAGCHYGGSGLSPSSASRGGQPASMASLEDGLGPLKAHFNKNKDRPRFLALLSPT
jgi:hypothetical protein